jgi:hypothetical protein
LVALGIADLAAVQGRRAWAGRSHDARPFARLRRQYSKLRRTRPARLVLPSPNGSAISTAAAASSAILIAGCLRNAAAGRWLAASGLGTSHWPVTVMTQIAELFSVSRHLQDHAAVCGDGSATALLASRSLPGRRDVPDKNKQNTIKATAISDRAGGLLWLGAFRADRMHDVTSVRTEASKTCCGHPRSQRG